MVAPKAPANPPCTKLYTDSATADKMDVLDVSRLKEGEVNLGVSTKLDEWKSVQTD